MIFFTIYIVSLIIIDASLGIETGIISLFKEGNGDNVCDICDKIFNDCFCEDLNCENKFCEDLNCKYHGRHRDIVELILEDPNFHYTFIDLSNNSIDVKNNDVNHDINNVSEILSSLKEYYMIYGYE
jgi:hypothetical protein